MTVQNDKDKLKRFESYRKSTVGGGKGYIFKNVPNQVPKEDEKEFLSTLTQEERCDYVSFHYGRM